MLKIVFLDCKWSSKENCLSATVKVIMFMLYDDWHLKILHGFCQKLSPGLLADV